MEEKEWKGEVRGRRRRGRGVDEIGLVQRKGVREGEETGGV